MSVTIYTMTHKKFEEPKDPMFVPLHVGKALHRELDLGYLTDDTGENISSLNPFFSELTGVYWVWKNDTTSDIIGISHYRRYLLNDTGKVYTSEEIERILDRCDLITTKKLTLPNSYYEGFRKRHHIEDLEAVRRAVGELYPQDLPVLDKILAGDQTYFGNMMIASRGVFDAYCQWLFSIFHRASAWIHPEAYDGYSKRVYGFLSEILLYVWTQARQKRVWESDVCVIGEKFETAQIKARMAELFVDGNVEKAKQELLAAWKKRPDILMEASDVTGELKLSMEVISIWEYEQRAGEDQMQQLLAGSSFEQVIAQVRRLNVLVQERKKQRLDEAKEKELASFSASAVQIAEQVMNGKEGA